jgi:hypothetical protein
MDFLSKLFRKRTIEPENKAQLEEPLNACCSDQVHIAYRGVSDDRLYLSYDRKWADVKFFRPNGLRVFCVSCRRRIV